MQTKIRMQRSFRAYLWIVLKGIGMGAADVVPGVSGGTIAFISGIYEELIYSISSLNLHALKLLFRGEFTAFARKINLAFLLSVFLGIGISILSLSKLMTFMLANYAIGTWAFFFGLIIASSWLVAKRITKWNLATGAFLFAGIIIAYLLTELSPAATPEDLWFVFLCGMLAICAMILPGVSGAFILLMMGKYAYILGAIDALNVKILGTFMIGALLGIVSFSNVLGYFLKHYHNATVAILTGFMIGSLNKVWPWKEVVSTFTDRHGVLKPLVERNVLPSDYSTLTHEPNYLIWAIVSAIFGFLLIFLVERFADKMKKE